MYIELNKVKQRRYMMSVTLELKDAEETKRSIAMLGLSQEEFANMIGINASMLNQYLNSKKRPNAKTAKKIALGLKVKVKDIFLP